MKKLGVILSFVLIILLILNFASFASATLIEASHYYNSYSEAYDSNNWNTVDLTDNLVFNKNTQSYAGELKTVNYQESPDNFGEFPKLQTTDTLTFDYFSDGTVKNCHSITTTRSRYNSNYCNTYNGQPNLQPWISSLNNFKTCFENPSCNLFSYTQTSETTFTYNATCYSDKLVVEGSMNTPKFHRQNSQANYESYSEYVKLVSTRDFTLSDPKIYLDPEYISRTEQTRKFTPTQITPFDDIICEVKVQDACGVNSNSPVNLKAQLLTRDSSGNWNVVLEESQSSEWTGMSPLDSQGNSLDYQIYQWKIKGWSEPSPVGWTSDNDKMEELISAGKVKCVVSDASNPANTVSTMPVITSNCVHVWGKEDAVKVGFLRGSSAKINPTNFFKLSKNEILEDGFGRFEPFKTYKYRFSFYLDLLNHDDSNFKIVGDQFDNVTNSKLKSLSSCSFKNAVFFNSRTYLGYTHNEIFYMNPEKIRNYKTFKDPDTNIRYNVNMPISEVFMHELGHSFGGLVDEYDSNVPGGPVESLPFRYRILAKALRILHYEDFPNCKRNPDWQGFGQTEVGPCFLFPNTKRPSCNSLMRYGNRGPYPDWRFNLVSCGYILKKVIFIGDGSLSAQWTKCSKLNVIQPATYRGNDCKTDSDCSNPCMYCSTCGFCTNVPPGSCSSRSNGLCYHGQYWNLGGTYAELEFYPCQNSVCSNGGCVPAT